MERKRTLTNLIEACHFKHNVILRRLQMLVAMDTRFSLQAEVSFFTLWVLFFSHGLKNAARNRRLN